MDEKKSEQLKDKDGRVIKYIRISVTDRCNFRCRYCVPQHPFEPIPSQDVLRYEDILFTVRSLAETGIDRVRITGGEPLVRKNLPYFLEQLNKIENIKEIALTTNATLLQSQASDIKQAGVRRINISLDSLKPDRYKYVTGGFGIEQTLAGIKKVVELGFAPIKINSVVIKGFNDDEIIDFCEFAATGNLIVRFIEFMPIGNSADWKKENIITGSEIIKIIGEKYNVTPLPKKPDTGPAKNFKLSNGAEVGIITPMSEHFCSTCDKIRLTSDGKIRPCLLSDREVSIADAAKTGNKELLIRRVKESLNMKNTEHTIETDRRGLFRRTMSKIGG
ncbi:MAG: GTP 3',8-cyclase MoaA [Deferribacteraceae bacterium]|jgi:cyclic pyranopterin phosphate synthase|nr:GTP 3',8-cyclase MoaA [Deferribacteraceae bacterium]